MTHEKAEISHPCQLTVKMSQLIEDCLTCEITYLFGFKDLLQAILEKHRSMVTATPPPSPTHGESADTPKKTPMSVINSSPAQSSK